MYFNDTVSKDNSLYHYALYLIGKTATDTTSLNITDFCRSANAYNRKGVYMAWRNSRGWEFDDSNYSTLPIATTTLVDSQQDYSLPSNALDVQRAEVLDNSGRYILLHRMDKEEVKDASLTEYYNTAGLPKYYDIVGNSILLYPAPSSSSVTTAAGLKLYFSRDVSSPTTPGAFRDISQEPGFHIMFHPYISYGVALDYGISKNYTQEKLVNIRLGLKEYEHNMTDYYSVRNDDYPTKFRPRLRSSL